MSDASFSKFVPGFDFLQGLMKNAGQSLPGIGQWVAPTLNPEELGKRIEELRTVQFWLEQNARMLAATIQALEVQRMTLSTLKTMNVPLNDLKQALQVPEFKMPGMPGMAAAGPASAPAPAQKTPAKPKKAAAAPADAAAPAVDPMQWWSALTQQFGQAAANAMKDTATDAAKGLAQNLMKQSIEAAGDTLRKAAAVPQAVAGSMVKGMAETASRARAANVKAAAAPVSPAASGRPAAKPAAQSATKKAARKR